jgi:CBS domain-containing protein
MQSAREIMTKDPACCTPDASVQLAAKMMCDNNCGEIPVVDDELHKRPVGVITDRDIACRVVAEGKDAKSLRVRDCMTAPAITVREEASIDDCCEALEGHKIRRVPVVDAQNHLRGIVSQADIACQASEKTEELVREVSQPV